ncbi:MAG: hypothetical protein E6682_15310 [Clostridium perfringens]|uniref:hypothetical protein n=1 Tax=Clostridium perfringens TaxID=1502 RepID=UPI0018A90A1F|nr:hypothetical protein [Clostridium perfringens]UVX36128.1 MAG: hypothetical protein [Bacteriophage sp.]EGT3604714.1 hypothetical protein [Clostridium perfringens]EHR1329649.1 hypothetical protein [Clostridium perfringens]EHR1332775.1 hypothetical protein [Clostridium perfringens]EHR1426325.1 hypothetical protein [Clostridium perfringens]
MLIKKLDMLCTKVEIKEKKDNKEQYLMISLLDLGSGDIFDILEKDLEVMKNIIPMTKYKVDLKLSSSKYGLSLAIESIGDSLGGI